MPARGVPLQFILLDEEVALKAIEGIPDILSDENAKAEVLYQQHVHCPNGCGPTMEKASGGTAFAFADNNWLIPRCIMKCHICGCSRNPFDGMIIEAGDRNKARYGDIPIIRPENK